MNLQFHHIGVACVDLDYETRTLAALGYAIEGEDFSDPIQGVRGRFLIGGGPRLELLSPLSETGGVLAPWLKARVKMYHLAYLTSELDSELERLQTGGAKVVVSPVSAIAFEKRRIAFLMMPNMLLTELIESA
jgi:methylmalonyl-CoA/ethylmalonyl-CoA epimerase